MDYKDLKVERTKDELQALRLEIQKLDEYIRERCYWGLKPGIPGPNGDLLAKYSDEKDALGLRSCSFRVCYENVHGIIQVSYYAYCNHKRNDTPNPKIAFMLRDAILDFNPSLPVRPMIYANANVSPNDRIDFIIWPDREKITDIHFWSHGEDMTNLLKGLDNI